LDLDRIQGTRYTLGLVDSAADTGNCGSSANMVYYTPQQQQ